MNGWIEGSELIPTDSYRIFQIQATSTSECSPEKWGRGPRIHHKGLRTLKRLSPYFVDLQP